MVSIGPYSESLNFTHMFNQRDLRGPLPLREETPGSMSYLIALHPDFSRFRYMLRLAKLDGLYNDIQADFTVFIPSDKALEHIPPGVFTNMDDATARHIILSSTLNRRITRDILEDSPASYFITRDPTNRLFITNISGRTYLNNDINVIHKDLEASNGIIHVIDALIIPLII